MKFEKFDKRHLIALYACFGAVFLLFVQACTTFTENQLELVEQIIEADPQRALLELNNIDREQFRTAKGRARYSLLLSMALDKNSVEKKEFNIIQPAIDYYSKWGSSTNKLRTYLYQGNIYLYRGETEKAMECYSKASDYASGCTDKHCLSRVYGSQAYIYKSLFNYDKSVEYALKAAEIMKEIRDTTNYFLELNSIVNSLLVLGEKEVAQSYLEECDTLWQRRRYASQRDYFRNRIAFAQKYSSEEETMRWIEKYLNAIPKEYVYWPAIADAYYKAGNIEKAEQAMACYDSFDGSSSAGVEATRAKILEAKGEYREALSHFKYYIHVTDSEDLVAYHHNTRAVPELHVLEVERERMRRGRLMLAMSLVATLLLLLLLTMLYRQRNEMSNLRIMQLEDEFEHLKELRQSEVVMDEEARAVLDGRLELLNKFFKAYISENGEEEKMAYREIETLLSDRQGFAVSTRKAFEASRPEFIRFLLEHGLDDKEINYCCLYALGLKGGEVGRYMRDSRHYHVSSEIRSKLGLASNDTNIGLFLRNLLRQLSV